MQKFAKTYNSNKKVVSFFYKFNLIPLKQAFNHIRCSLPGISSPIHALVNLQTGSDAIFRRLNIHHKDTRSLPCNQKMITFVSEIIDPPKDD
jgi:hypothetical protein